MALSITNNVSSLTAQQNLGKTSNALSKSLERLSTGLKVNRGADGPAALVISERQRAQIAGLKTAIDNTNKAIAVVQTGEGALNEVNGLLNKIRGLALDSANSGVNDSNALAANQAEISNALSTIDTIANTTKFGTKSLLNGQAGINAAVSGTNNVAAQGISAGSTTAAGNYVVAITTQGTGGRIAGVASNGASLTAAASITLTGGGLTSGLAVALDTGDNVNTIGTKIQSALDNASSQGGGKGKFNVGVSALGVITVNSNVLGSAGVTVATSGTGGVVAVSGFTAAATTTAGTALAATVSFNGGLATTVTPGAGSNGLNNAVSFGGANGLNLEIGVTGGQTAAASNTTITVADNSLVFQIGANQNETAKVSIDKVTANALAQGVSGLSNANTTDLSKIDVTSQAGAQDAIKVVDSAIAQVSTIRGRLGAFQSNTLESNSRNLSATLENTVSAESVIRDTDFAEEIANFTRLQTQVQAGSTVLGNANQLTQQIAQLLRG